MRISPRLVRCANGSCTQARSCHIRKEWRIPVTNISTATVASIMPIRRSIACSPLLPRIRLSGAENSITMPAASHAQKRANSHSGQREGSLDPRRMTDDIDAGPAMRGTARGTTSGELPPVFSNMCSELSPPA